MSSFHPMSAISIWWQQEKQKTYQQIQRIVIPDSVIADSSYLGEMKGITAVLLYNNANFEPPRVSSDYITFWRNYLNEEEPNFTEIADDMAHKEGPLYDYIMEHPGNDNIIQILEKIMPQLMHPMLDMATKTFDVDINNFFKGQTSEYFESATQTAENKEDDDTIFNKLMKTCIIFKNNKNETKSNIFELFIVIMDIYDRILYDYPRFGLIFPHEITGISDNDDQQKMEQLMKNHHFAVMLDTDSYSALNETLTNFKDMTKKSFFGKLQAISADNKIKLIDDKLKDFQLISLSFILFIKAFICSTGNHFENDHDIYIKHLCSLSEQPLSFVSNVESLKNVKFEQNGTETVNDMDAIFDNDNFPLQFDLCIIPKKLLNDKLYTDYGLEEQFADFAIESKKFKTPTDIDSVYNLYGDICESFRKVICHKKNIALFDDGLTAKRRDNRYCIIMDRNINKFYIFPPHINNGDDTAFIVNAQKKVCNKFSLIADEYNDITNFYLTSKCIIPSKSVGRCYGVYDLDFVLSAHFHKQQMCHTHPQLKMYQYFNGGGLRFFHSNKKLKNYQYDEDITNIWPNYFVKSENGINDKFIENLDIFDAVMDLYKCDTQYFRWDNAVKRQLIFDDENKVDTQENDDNVNELLIAFDNDNKNMTENNADVPLFVSKQGNVSQPHDDTPELIRNCYQGQCMEPMIQALKYYMTLDVDNDDKHKQQLITYCRETYECLLEDCVHIIEHHNDDIEMIYEMISTKYEFPPCNINNCACLLRHYRNREEDKYDPADITDNFSFYRDIMDSMHCYLLHLYDIGMKVKVENPIQTYLDNWVDAVYSRIVMVINEKKKALKKINGFNHDTFETNKFNVNRNKSDHETEGETFSDALYKFLTKFGQIEQKEVDLIEKHLNDEEYDSDAIKCDLEVENKNVTPSNVYIKTHCDTFKRYVYLNKLSEHTFATGFGFWYWHSTINLVEMDETGGTNIDDHSGYRQSDLFVKNKYNSMKEELTTNTIYALKMHQFNISVNKANEYLQLNRAKSTKVGNRKAFLYGIANDAVLSGSHILSIVLYTDWGPLCSAFSATFRKTNLYEPISSVVKRNQEFANWSKTLRETVECFGTNPWEQQAIMSGDDIEPLFCGMSFVMIMPECHIRLAGPTSTSKRLEVAQNFATDDGIVIQLNSGHTYHDFAIRAFCCNWISNYTSEDEYLFCGGRWRVRIETVINQMTKQNFSDFMRPLFYLDCMLNGSKIYQADITEQDYLFLNNLIKHKLKINGFENKYPRYINNTFDAYTNHKTQIVLHLHWINKIFEDLKSLILYTRRDTKLKQYEYRYNLFKPVLLDLFPNVAAITMYCALGDWVRDEYYQYPLNLQQIIPILQSTASLISQDVEINIKAVHQYALMGTYEIGYSWIMQMFEEEIEEEFVNAGLLASITQTSYGEDKMLTTMDGYSLLIPKKIEDCLMIRKSK